MSVTLTFPKQMPPAISLGAGRWKTAEPWAFMINEEYAVIPAGFICDLYSVPFPLSILIPRDERDNRPALIHDWLYATVGLRDNRMSPSCFTRAQCDEALQVACRLCGFPARRVWSIHTGVRLGGWRPWSDLDDAGHSLVNPKMD